jgi:hypothetical protein
LLRVRSAVRDPQPDSRSLRQTTLTQETVIAHFQKGCVQNGIL